MPELLDSKSLVAALMDTDASVSRAGRNCAVGLRRNPQTARAGGAAAAGGGTVSGSEAGSPRGSATVEASPTSTVAAGSPNSTTGGGLTSRGARTAREKAAVKALNITSSANDHKLAFGRGIVDDDGKRHELCSSPRPHPELDRFLLSEFQEGRRAAFEDIQGRVSAMELVDAAAVELEIEARGRDGPIKPPTTAAPLPDLKTTTHEEPMSPRTPQALTPRLTPQAAGLKKPGQIPALDLSAVKGSPTATAKKQTAGGASPRPKKDIPSAAFTAPERFREPANAPMYPEVGYYRPKHASVQHRVTHGLMQPPGASSSRVPRAEEPKDEVLPVSEFVKRAREEVRPRALKEREERRKERAARDDDDDDDGLTPKKKSAGVPQPGRDSSPAFKSKVAGTTVAARGSAAPDTMYWPIAENGTHMRASAAIDFTKQTPRPPLAENVVLPDPRAVVTAFSPDVARNAPDLSKYSPRQGFSPRRPPPDGPLHPERADAVRYGRTRVADFSSAPLDPRAGAVAGSRRLAGDGGVVSCELVDTIRNPGEKPVHSPRMDKAPPRKAPKPPLDLPPLDLDHTTVDHRARAAIIRADAGGHGSVFTGAGGAANAEVGQYNPNIDAIRPKTLRNVDFSQGTPRSDPQANIADLTYDVKPVSPRVRGNPMIAQQVSRAKRENVLAAKSGAADVTYDVKPPPLTGRGMCELSRQVNRYNHAPGRAPAQRTVDRQRKQQDSAAAAAQARMDEKARGKGGSSRTTSPRH